MLLESIDFGPDRDYIAILSPKQEVVRTKQTQAKGQGSISRGRSPPSFEFETLSGLWSEGTAMN